jgi:prepilin-type N-terminal cleavage/methylation domain-containing protein
MKTLLHNAPRRPRRIGFTLIELLMVIVIMAVIAALVIPEVARSDSFQAQGAARMLVGDLLYAQNEAISHQQQRQVVFDPGGESYRLLDGQGVTLPASWLGGSYRVNLDQQNFGSVDLVSTTFANNTVRFDDLGAPSEGGDIELAAGSHRYRITVVPLTGRVEVAELGQED